MSGRWQNWAGLVAGVWLLISPWVLGFSTGATERWTTVGVGAAVTLVAVWALAMPAARFAEWSAIALGLGLFLAPWTLSFTQVGAAAWNAWILGAVVAILAAWALLLKTGRVGGPMGRRHRPAH